MTFCRASASRTIFSVISNTPRVGAALAIAGLIAVHSSTLYPAKAQPDAATSKSPAQTVSVLVDDAQVTKALEQLDQLARDVLERTGLPGLAVAVTWKGQTVFAEGYGLRKVGALETVDRDTVFQIASLSKSLAGTVVAGKVGEGLARWDDPVVRFLPDFRLSDPAITERVTIGDLFSHRSGLPDHAGDDLEELGYDRAEVLERLQYLRLGAFRTQYAYTNFGLTAAAEAVAVASGTDWASLADNVLYKPLGMTRTSSRFEDYMARDNRAYPHVREQGSYESLYQRMPDPQSPAGGVSSSVSDLAKWMALVLGGGEFQGKQVIGAKALLAAASGQVISDHAFALDARSGLYGYGFGSGVEPTGRTTISHSGAFTLGTGTSYLMIPDLDLGIVVLTNAQPIGAAESLARSFIDIVEYGAPTRDWLAGYAMLFKPLTAPVGEMAGKPLPSNPEPARVLRDYEGRYGNSYFGPIEVEATEQGLKLLAGPKDLSFELAHWNGDIFYFEPRLENAPAGSRSLVRFEAGEAGTASAVWIEYFDENGLGTFRRQ